jgi:hypothetical protein
LEVRRRVSLSSRHYNPHHRFNDRRFGLLNYAL